MDNKNSTAEISEKSNASDHLANERTYLAWVRTGIGIMAFGFVVVKFSLFIKQLAIILGSKTVVPQKGYSLITGIILVGLGVLINLLAYLRYKRTKEQLSTGSFNQSTTLITILTVVITLIGAALLVYLIAST